MERSTRTFDAKKLYSTHSGLAAWNSADYILRKKSRRVKELEERGDYDHDRYLAINRQPELFFYTEYSGTVFFGNPS